MLLDILQQMRSSLTPDAVSNLGKGPFLKGIVPLLSDNTPEARASSRKLLRILEVEFFIPVFLDSVLSCPRHSRLQAATAAGVCRHFLMVPQKQLDPWIAFTGHCHFQKQVYPRNLALLRVLVIGMLHHPYNKTNRVPCRMPSLLMQRRSPARCMQARLMQRAGNLHHAMSRTHREVFGTLSALRH
jgi:hypothetical protein